jgi:uroporphyrinogen-III synthase
MQFALLSRPLWAGSALIQTLIPAQSAPANDPRLISAPLQQLEFIQTDQFNPPSSATIFNYLTLAAPAAANPWFIFTSPASVQAFGFWVLQIKAQLPFTHARLAAVGTGTLDRLKELQRMGFFSEDQIKQAICEQEKEKADAQGLLEKLNQSGTKQAINWSDHFVLLVQGQGNRPTLADGLNAMGANVARCELYRRVDIDWPKEVLAKLKTAAPGQAGVVLTSTTVVDRALQLLGTNMINPKAVVWCTQHQAIADRLQQAGAAQLNQIRRVRLDTQYLIHDLFEHENYW